VLNTDFAATMIAMIKEDSIAAAARWLGLTAETVALRIKMVEAELGATLIRVDPSTHARLYLES
jgi:DNA-binding transcriptional LysR family regulator